MSLHPPLPVPDDVSAPFWEGLLEQKLLVQRCTHCRRLQYPPYATCIMCDSASLAFEQVSGRGTIYTFTQTVSGARHPYFQAAAPYLVGHVELEEQEGLLMASNFPGSTLEDLSVGAAVEVHYDEIEPGTVVPQFRLAPNHS